MSSADDERIAAAFRGLAAATCALHAAFSALHLRATLAHQAQAGRAWACQRQWRAYAEAVLGRDLADKRARTPPPPAAGAEREVGHSKKL